MHPFFSNVIQKKDELFFSSGEENLNITYSEYAMDIYNCLQKIEDTVADISGRHIGVLAENSYEYLVTLGALFIGKACVVLINTYESEENIDYIISDSDVEILVVSDRFSKYNSKTTLNIRNITTNDRRVSVDFIELFNRQPEDSEIIIYTSGTTDLPKGVVHSLSSFLDIIEGNFANNADFALGIKKMYITVPMYHVMGFYYWLMSMRADCTLYLNYDPGNMIIELKKIMPDLIIATPAFVGLLKKAVGRNSNWINELKFVISGGAILNKDVINELLKKKIVCLNVYGMTETCGSGTCNLDIAGHTDSIGLPSADVKVKIIDGEICLSCSSMMKGYYKNDKATREVFTDDYFHTGDLGYIADDGYVYITGRKKNLIILSGGENVSPEELEKLVCKNLEVKECLVYEQNDRLHLRVFADTQFHEDIQKYVSELNKTLPIFKRIYGVEFTTCEFEKTANGKIKRRI